MDAFPGTADNLQMELLIRIKRCALANRLRLTSKARDELEADDLEIDDVRESYYLLISSKHAL